MLFTVLPVGTRAPTARNKAFLLSDNWDDWFKFATLFGLVVFDGDGTKHDIGGVKIGQFGMPKGHYNRPSLPPIFEQLNESFFSLGQDDSYYERLNALGDEPRNAILSALRDVAIDPDLFERALNEDVTKTSLLRSVSPLTVRGQFRRIAQGDARLTHYQFVYEAPKNKGSRGSPPVLQFEVEPESNPPTNIHVLIGRNGVGKTYLLRQMSRALIDADGRSKRYGMFSSDEAEDVSELFANLVSVTFSAFDPFEAMPEKRDASSGMRYSYIGLQRADQGDSRALPPKSPRALANEFVKSMLACQIGAERGRWRKALETLEADPLFREAEVTALADGDNGEEWQKHAASVFGKFSSGHKVVLLTLTRLVQTVDERTLVLLDEPEAHLHPPLLSAFVRALSDLLIQRNGVAIIATRSPVILQEIPKNCVWKLRRVGAELRAERPDVETFGDNVGVLTREAFGLEVTHSGFHKLLQDAVDRGMDYDEVVDHFNEHLGAEARAIVRAIATRDTET